MAKKIVYMDFDIKDWGDNVVILAKDWKRIKAFLIVRGLEIQERVKRGAKK